MSTSIDIKGYTGKTNPEFIIHLEAVEFCFKNNLSLPKETSEFFKGKIEGGNIEDFTEKAALEYVRKGFSVPLAIDRCGFDYILKVKDIPSSVDEIVITLV